MHIQCILTCPSVSCCWPKILFGFDLHLQAFTFTKSVLPPLISYTNVQKSKVIIKWHSYLDMCRCSSWIFLPLPPCVSLMSLRVVLTKHSFVWNETILAHEFHSARNANANLSMLLVHRIVTWNWSGSNQVRNGNTNMCSNDSNLNYATADNEKTLSFVYKKRGIFSSEQSLNQSHWKRIWFPGFLYTHGCV